jgi:ribosomal protein L29
MEIQLYRALLEAGVKEETASKVVDSLESELKERLSDARKELATRADIAEIRKEIAEAKTEIIKWNLASIIAVVGVMIALTRLTGHA